MSASRDMVGGRRGVEELAPPPPTDFERRAAYGKEARRRTRRSSHARWVPAPDRADPVALLEEQATTRVPELVPIRHGADAGLAVHLLPRCRAADGRRPGQTRPYRASTTQICGDAHLSNFGVFALAGTRAGVRHQRLRRDPARARGSGTSSGWRPASTIAGRDNAASSTKERAQASARRCRAGYREPMRQFAGHAQPRGLVRPARRRATLIEPSCRRAGAAGKQAQATEAERRQGPHARQHAGLSQADRRRRRRAADHQRPAAHRADRGAVQPVERRRRSDGRAACGA